MSMRLERISHLVRLFHTLLPPGLILFCLIHAAQGVRYVSHSGSHTPPYDTWATAANDIQTAVDAASATREIIWVTNGTYTLTSGIKVLKSVTVRSVNGPLVTVIDGAGSYRCMLLTNGAIASGFTLTNGWAKRGAGINFKYGGIATNFVIVNSTADTADGFGGGAYFNHGGRLYNSTVENNYAGYDGGGAYFEGPGGVMRACTLRSNRTGWDGAGIYLSSGGLVTNCLIESNYAATNAFGGGATLTNGGLIISSTLKDNYAGYDGGGAYCWNGGMIAHSQIIENRADGDGAGVFVLGTGIISNCMIRANTCSGYYIGYGRGGGAVLDTGGLIIGSTIKNNSAADVGGGLFMTGCPRGSGALSETNGTVYNCAVLANRAFPAGSGIWASGGNIMSCTLIDNGQNQPYTYAGGLYATNDAVISCNIIYYNLAASDPNHRIESPIYGLFDCCTIGEPAGLLNNGNTNGPPGLISFPISAHEYHLDPSSVCINYRFRSTWGWMSNQVDIDAQARVQEGMLDIGCDEFAPVPPGFDADAGPNMVTGEGYAVTFDASGSLNGGGSPLKYRWYFGDGSSPTEWLDTPTVTHTYGVAGIYTSRLIVLNDVSLDMDNCTATVTAVPPTVVAGGPYTAYAGEPLNVLVSGSATGDYALLKYRFDFDGTGYSSWGTSSNASHTYLQACATSFWVQCGKFLDIMDPTPASTGTARGTVTVLPGLSAQIRGPEEGGEGEALAYYASRTGGSTDNLRYRWNFGDGSPWSTWSASSNAAHTYVTDSVFTITMEITNSYLLNATSAVVTVTNCPPVIETVTYIPDAVWLEDLVTLSVTARDPGSNDLMEYDYNWTGQWSGWSSSSNDTHTCTNGGRLTLQVRVRDAQATGAVFNTQLDVTVAGAQDTAVSNGAPCLSWKVVSNQAYRIERALDLNQGAWTNISGTFTALSERINFIETNNWPDAVYRSIWIP